jgi:hypothetical protein
MRTYLMCHFVSPSEIVVNCPCGLSGNFLSREVGIRVGVICERCDISMDLEEILTAAGVIVVPGAGGLEFEINRDLSVDVPIVWPDQDPFGEEWKEYHGIKCECGSDKLGLGGHSQWCPKAGIR